MLKVYHQTNKMHETILRLQKEVMITEQQFIQDFRQLCQDIYNVRQQTALGIDPGYEKMIQAVENVATDDDWNDFCEHHKQDLISENARFLHPDQLEYPNHTHPLVQPVFAARMERNSNFLHRWHEYIYVLTPGKRATAKVYHLLIYIHKLDSCMNTKAVDHIQTNQMHQFLFPITTYPLYPPIYIIILYFNYKHKNDTICKNTCQHLRHLHLLHLLLYHSRQF